MEDTTPYKYIDLDKTVHKERSGPLIPEGKLERSDEYVPDDSSNEIDPRELQDDPPPESAPYFYSYPQYVLDGGQWPMSSNTPVYPPREMVQAPVKRPPPPPRSAHPLPHRQMGQPPLNMRPPPPLPSAHLNLPRAFGPPPPKTRPPPPQPPTTLKSKEAEFQAQIDTRKPLISSLRDTLCALEKCTYEVDVPKVGLVLQSYDKEGRLDPTTYKMAVESFAKSTLTVRAISALGIASPSSAQYGSNFMMNVTLLPKNAIPAKALVTDTDLKRKYSVVNVTMEFEGTSPFKEKTFVSTRGHTFETGDISKNITKLARCVLAQIFVGPDSHKDYAVRHRSGNKSNALLSLPITVYSFVEEFILRSVGVSRRYAHPCFCASDLAKENLELAAKMGKTEEEREKAMESLKDDIEVLVQLIFCKVQRLLNDLRQRTLDTSLQVPAFVKPIDLAKGRTPTSSTTSTSSASNPSTNSGSTSRTQGSDSIEDNPQQ